MGCFGVLLILLGISIACGIPNIGWIFVILGMFLIVVVLVIE